MNKKQDTFFYEKYQCIYKNPDEPDAFIYGKILLKDNECCLISMLSPYGDFDGYLVIRTNSIIKYEIDEEYDAKMNLYKHFSNIQEQRIQLQYSGNVLYDVLSYLAIYKKVVSLEVNDSGCTDFLGIISSFNSCRFELVSYDEIGKKQKVVEINCESCSEICFSTPYEILIEKIINNS